jgi:hypothetical protein
MANSSHDYPTISESQASKATTANGMDLAASPAMLWGIDPPNTAGLTLGLLEGCLNVAGTPTQIAATTVSLTGSATNYVEATTAGVVSVNTSAFTGGRLRLYTVVCGSSTITSYTDHRHGGTSAGITGTPGALADGDYGDITVSGTGTALTVDNDAITYAKLQNVSATSRILGRKTASAGDAEECTLSEVLDFVGSAAQGDILYRGASTWTRLAAGTSGHFLKTQGAGANPTWAAASVAPSVTTVTYSGTTTIDLSTIPHGGIARITLTGNITIQLSNGTDGQKFVLELIQDGTGSRTVSLSGTYFRFGTDITSFTATTTASKMDRVGCIYNGTATKADVVAVVKGF